MSISVAIGQLAWFWRRNPSSTVDPLFVAFKRFAVLEPCQQLGRWHLVTERGWKSSSTGVCRQGTLWAYTVWLRHRQHCCIPLLDLTILCKSATQETYGRCLGTMLLLSYSLVIGGWRLEDFDLRPYWQEINSYPVLTLDWVQVKYPSSIRPATSLS